MLNEISLTAALTIVSQVYNNVLVLKHYIYSNDSYTGTVSRTLYISVLKPVFDMLKHSVRAFLKGVPGVSALKSFHFPDVGTSSGSETLNYLHIAGCIIVLQLYLQGRKAVRKQVLRAAIA